VLPITKARLATLAAHWELSDGEALDRAIDAAIVGLATPTP
jgi:hypothetical protein